MLDVGAQVSGQLKKLYVNIGDRVKQGQLLAEIDPQVLTAKVQQDWAGIANPQAQLSDRRAQAALAAANHQRQRRLPTANATRDRLRCGQATGGIDRRPNRGAASAGIRTSALSGDSIQLGYTKIYALMSGKSGLITTKQGQTIARSQQALGAAAHADLSTRQCGRRCPKPMCPNCVSAWMRISQRSAIPTSVGSASYRSSRRRRPSTTVPFTPQRSMKNPDNKLMTQMTAQVFL